MASKRNTTFNNEYVINALFGKEWKINNKWMLTTDMKFTAAEEDTLPPSIWLLRSWQAEVLQQDKAFTEKLGPYLRMDLKIGVKPTVRAGASILPWTSKSYQSPKRLFEAIQCHCRSA